MESKTISINRVPFLTLWATVVGQRLGFNEDDALTLGKALAGLNAQAKGRRLGIFKPHEVKPTKAREKERGEEFWIELCGRPIPAKITLVNLSKTQPRTLILQGGAYGEHLVESVTVGDKTTTVQSPLLTIRLEPGCGQRLVLQMKRYANKPLVLHPWQRV